MNIEQMSKYRIIEKHNKITSETLFVAQVKSFFWWFDCEMELGWNCSVKAAFKNKEEAQVFIYNRKAQEAWRYGIKN